MCSVTASHTNNHRFNSHRLNIIRTVAPSCNPATGGQGYGMVLNTIHIDVDLKSGLCFTAGNVVPLWPWMSIGHCTGTIYLPCRQKPAIVECEFNSKHWGRYVSPYQIVFLLGYTGDIQAINAGSPKMGT